MNKRIKELAIKAGLSEMPSNYPDMADLYKGADFELERFAELIIKECIEVCERQQYYDADDYYKKGFNSGSKTCVNSLKRNFGIDKWSKFYHG
jgi:hypothetical protein